MKSRNTTAIAAVTVFVILLAQMGLPPALGGPTVAYAADGLAQLKVVTPYNIKSITVVGANQNDDAVTWENDYGEDSIITEVSIDNWWWRFKWFCPSWSPFCEESGFPQPDTISPYVWIRYTNGVLDHQRCVPDTISQDTNWVTCEFVLPPQRANFKLTLHEKGVALYQEDATTNPDYVQVVNLKEGASVELRHGDEAPNPDGKPGAYGGPNPGVRRETLQNAWTGFSSTNNRALCMTNGAFFAPNLPTITVLAYPLKMHGTIFSEGYAPENAADPRLMLEIWPDENRADIRPLSQEALYSPDAPEILAGLPWDSPRYWNEATLPTAQRTFIGIDDADGDTKLETVLIFNSPDLITTKYAREVLTRDFGADKVIMLDGGGSTQLICKGQPYVPSSDPTPRTIPQTIAVSRAPDSIPPTPIARGLQYLRVRQLSDGSWSSNVGITGLAALAFLNNGYTEDDPSVQRAIQYILANRQADGSIHNESGHATYHTGIAMLPLKATHNADYADEIQAAKDWLVTAQWDAGEGLSESNWQWGGFGYGRNVRPDLSNTQFAVMGLDAADLPNPDPTNDTWTKVLKFASRCQNRTASNEGYSTNNDGGFNYLPGQSVVGGDTSIGSTTGAGMWSIALSGLTPADGRFADALKWMENHYSWDYNPSTGGDVGNYGVYYYYLSMSKALSMARKTTIGGVLGIGAHDWYKDLSNKLASLQGSDGSWVNPDGSLGEGDPSLVTSYAILALQTRKLPANADLELVIILHSPADLHLYDAYGQHTGKNYDTGGIDLRIPNSTYSSDDPQTIRVHPPEAGNYHLELVGTESGEYHLDVVGMQDGVQVSYAAYTGTVTNTAVLATDLNLGAFEGALTIFSNQPQLAPIMRVEPDTLRLAQDQGRTIQATFAVSETQGSQPIEGVGIFASDLKSNGGFSIPRASLTITPTDFDLPAGSSQLVTVTIPLPVDLPDAVYSGTVTIESLTAGTKGVQIAIQAGGPHGYVWLDKDGNGHSDPGEGLAEVVVIISDAAVAAAALAPEATWAAVTDAEGRYRFPVIPVGSYLLTTNDLQQRISPISRHVDVTWGVLELPDLGYRKLYLPVLFR